MGKERPETAPAGPEQHAQASRQAMRLVAVVVTHNRLDQLKVTLDRLLSEPADRLDGVVVVDNASGDGTSRWLAGRSDPRLEVVRSAANLGGSGGFAPGLEVARAVFDPDWMLLMDDDARPEPGALAMFHAAPRPTGAAVAAAVYYPDGRICEMNRPSVNPFWNVRIFLRTLLLRGRDGYHISRAVYAQETTVHIDLCSFVGFFVSRRIVRQTGLPDAKLFLYGDDVIYTLRLRKEGFQIQFDPRIRFEHDCSTFENDRRRVFRPIWKVYYAYRNGLLMYHQAAGLMFWPLLLLVVPKWWLAGRRYGDERAVYSRLMRRAVRDAVLRRTELAHDEVLALARPVSD